MTMLHLNHRFAQPEPDEATSLMSGSWRRRVPRGANLTRQIKRHRNTGAPLDIGFDLKSAATDCLKKCATLVGVGLYLTRKDDELPRMPAQPPARNGSKTREHHQRSVATAEQSGSEAQAAVTGGPAETNDMLCERCSQQLQLTKTRDGGTWTPEQLAAYTRREHNRTLCSGCVRSLRGGTPERSTVDSAPD